VFVRTDWHLGNYDVSRLFADGLGIPIFNLPSPGIMVTLRIAKLEVTIQTAKGRGKRSSRPGLAKARRRFPVFVRKGRTVDQLTRLNDTALSGGRRYA
jgi:hypothetical protein